MEEKMKLEEMIEILEEMKVDNQKLYIKGNKSCAARLRKKYTELQKIIQEEKKHILEFKNSLPTKSKKEA